MSKKPADKRPNVAANIQQLLANAWSHFQAGRFMQAGTLYRRILELQPDNVDALRMLGGVASKTGRLQVAKQLLELAIKIQPLRPDLYNNLGFVLTEMRNPEAAEIVLDRALELDPAYSDAYLNRACIHKRLGRIEASISDSRKSLQHNPDSIIAKTNLLFVMNCSDHLNATDISREHLSFGKHYESQIDSTLLTQPAARHHHKRLRIGYVSPDFRTHSVAYFMEPVLEHHDREKFHIYGYYNNNLEDNTTRHIRNLCDKWLNTSSLDDKQLAKRIRHDQIDILVDLAGHTGSSRLLAFAYNPAPAQLTWLGYPNTTGLTSIGYRITDAMADPPGLTDHLYSEKLVRIPGCFLCYQPPDDYPDIAVPPFLNNGFITFGSFNDLGKVTNSVLTTWSKLLHLVPNSRLILKNTGLSSTHRQAELVDEFASKGIQPDRITLWGSVPSRYEHLSRYSDIDIALDTFPYNGTTTTCEALWMGLPVIAYCGECHRDRVGASLLQAAGLGELLGNNRDDYLEIAKALACDSHAIQNYRATLRSTLTNSPLMDAVGFTKKLEKVYLEISGNNRTRDTSSA